MRLLWFSGIATAALFCGIVWYLAPLNPGALALQFAITPRAFGAIVHVWSEAQLARYRAHLPFDFALIAAYATFGYRLVTHGSVFAGCGRVMTRAAAWCLPAAGVFDVLENLFHGWLTVAPRFGVPGIYAASAGCSLLKWLLLAGFGALVLHALAREEHRPAAGDG